MVIPAVVFNSSPIIILSKLGYLEQAFELFQKNYIVPVVVEEINQKHDEVKIKLEKFINAGKIIVKT